MSEKLTCSVPEMARLLGVSKTTGYELVKTPGFPAITVGKRVLIYRAGLDRWLEAQVEKGGAEMSKTLPPLHE